MRQYLEKFFSDYEYSADDARILLDAYDKIKANNETKILWEQAISLYDESIDCDYLKIIELSDEVAKILYLEEYTLNLLIFICLTLRAEKVYKEHKIDMQIFYDTMLDLRYKLEECKLVKGVVGTFVPRWFRGFFNLTRFTLWRLQFEVIDFGETYEKDGKVLTPESKVLNIHIPRTMTPLDEASCDESFRKAKEFFKEKIGDECVFVCRSWLLYPENEKILSEKSNVYRFMKRFEIISHFVDKAKQDLWRIFDTDEKNIERLPKDTSMQRAFIKHMKNGGKVGLGRGIYFL